MIVYGKEYQFRLTVGASAELSKICPNNDLGQIGKIMGKDYSSNVEFTAKMAAIMSKAHETAIAFEQGEACLEQKISPLTEEMALSLNPKAFFELQKEVYAAFARDTTTTVEVEPEKKRSEEKKSN